MPNKVGNISLETDLDEFCVELTKRADPNFPNSDGQICMHLLVGDSGRKREQEQIMIDQMAFTPGYSNVQYLNKLKGSGAFRKGSSDGQQYGSSSHGEYRTLAEKYLTPTRNFIFGLHYVEQTKSYNIGKVPVTFDGDDFLVQYGRGTMRYKGTDGLWRLLTQDITHHGDLKYFTDPDWVVYMEIVLRANQPEQASISMFNREEPSLLGILGCIGSKITDFLKTQLEEAAKKALGTLEGFLDGGLKKAKDFIYGKIGQLGSDIYEILKGLCPELTDQPADRPTDRPKDRPTDRPTDKPKVPGKDPDLFDELGSPACAYIRDLDELLRRLVSLQRLKLSQKMYCGFTQSCLLFWIAQRFVAAMGRLGADLLIEWAKLNKTLLIETELLKKMSVNLPFGYHYRRKPLCGPTPSEEEAVKRGSKKDTDCVVHDEKYFSFQKRNPKMEQDIKIGMEVLNSLFNSDPKFFEKLDMFKKISTKDLNTAIDKAYRYLRIYYR
ncbi:hypothetical protein LSTR_LSTR013087 [Laodelphax striatellus]|uniref:DUF8207 domain-containing protein n=1 Tax=Laodelphax striatellus TaxID=195883 RepID=A0A482XLJ7_LAOST|nr:hypothetical protein LSTR_LSTR013087 [Laodelphax striatellus]